MAIPSLQAAEKLALGFTILPLAKEIFSDSKTPITILRQMQEKSQQFFMLESVTGQENWGRYSFLGFDPNMVIKGKNTTVTLTSKGYSQVVETPAPLDEIRKVLNQYRSPRVEDLPPFTGGLVGYFSYDFACQLNRGLSLGTKDPLDMDDFQFMVMDKVIAFDHFKQKIYLIVNIPTKDLSQSYPKGLEELEKLENMLCQQFSNQTCSPFKCGEFVPRFGLEEYSGLIDKAKQYISEGDLLTVTPSSCFSAECTGSLLTAYRVLRTAAPSPYMVYLQLEGLEIACASPVTLINLRDGVVSTCPMAGTSAQANDNGDEESSEQDLLHNQQELAKHDIQVDLSRNDIGKISCFGTVQVREYREIKNYSHTSHLASRVIGRIKEGKDALDAIVAAMPAGITSGAPKKRACEIIHELEGGNRGIYGGAMGYIDFAGDMDMCIGVQIAVQRNGKVYVQAGSNIVHSTDPKQAYQETVDKAQDLIKCLHYAERMSPNGGID